MQANFLVYRIVDTIPESPFPLDPANPPILVERAEIVRVGECPEGSESSQAGSGEVGIEGISDPAFQYVLIEDGFPRVVDKPGMDLVPDKTEVAADNVEILTVYNVPPNVRVAIHDAMNPGLGPIDFVDDVEGILQKTFATPGVFLIIFSAFPYLDGQVQVAAT
jgi:hypothetical protein